MVGKKVEIETHTRDTSGKDYAKTEGTLDEQ